jgi:hypothetical protein
MPFVSRAQVKWGHSPAGKRALGGPSAVKEWDRATDFGKLPERKEGVLAKSIRERVKAKRG